MDAGSNGGTVLVLAPVGRDADLACTMLREAGLTCRHCRDIDDLVAQPVASCGALVLTEEVLSDKGIRRLSALLDAQPPWSNVPVIVFVGRDSLRQAPGRNRFDALGASRGMILLERPLRVASFLSITHSALLTRQRQYELRDQLVGRREAEEHARLLTQEMKHRIKNSLAMVNALALQTFRQGVPVEEALDDFAARLQSMAAAQDMLTEDSGDGTDLRHLVSKALAPYRTDGDADRIDIHGPMVRIAGRRITALSMALHELATNAVKYGALSVASGRVTIRWSMDEGQDHPQLHIEWREHGGPPVTPPERRGFGSRLIERGLAMELGGRAKISFDTAGVVCEISAAVERLQESSAV